MASPDRPEDAARDTTLPASFRPDIEGLRGVAVVTVLLCHAGLPFAAGGYVGVDVFFVISGFVITRLLLNEIDRTKTISLTRFFARRAKRLLPLAALVLLVTTLLSGWNPLPAGPEALSRDTAAAALYVANWRFAATSTDYFAGPDQVSPVQHFWSLAVEEQFYLVWPLLLLALAWWWIRSGRPLPRAAVGATLIVVGVASLLYAAFATAQAPGAAYFSSLARAWELALGAGLATVPLAMRAPRAVAAVLCWGGLAAIVVATAAFGKETAFPGPPALLPTLGAAALIVAGTARTQAAPLRALASRPMQALGRHSYALYLWHWPLLVFAGSRWGPLSPAEGVAVVLLSAVPAVLSHRWVEEPLRRSQLHFERPRLTLASVPCAALVVIAAALLLPHLDRVPSLAAADVRGAAAMGPGATLQKRADGLRPTPRKAAKDRSRAYTDGCLAEERDTRSKRCVYGARSARRTVVLFGDSKAMQYFPAIDAVSRKRRRQMVELTKAGCPVSAVRVHNTVLRRAYRECDAWREHALRRIERMDPKPLVVASSATFYRVYDGGRRLGPKESAERLQAGWVRTLERLRRAGAEVVVVEDSPDAPGSTVSCVRRSLKKLGRCAFDRDKALSFPHVASRAARAVDGVRLVDPVGRFCLRRVCPAVIGDVLVYRNGGHVTATYARTMARWFDRRLRRALRAAP